MRFNYSDVIAVVLDGDDSHDVGGVLRVRVRAVLVGQHQAGVSLVNLRIRLIKTGIDNFFRRSGCVLYFFSF